jgi:hypothetical protein
MQRFANVQLFEPDLINLPPADFLPDWYQPIRSDEDLSDVWEDEGEGADWYDEDDAGGAGEAGIASQEAVVKVTEGEKLDGDEKGSTGKEAGGRDSGGAGSGVG